MLLQNPLKTIDQKLLISATSTGSIPSYEKMKRIKGWTISFRQHIQHGPNTLSFQVPY